jgi:hypothetical protein
VEGLAVALAESFEQAPVSARAPLAGRLTDVLERLENAELDPATLELLEGSSKERGEREQRGGD